MVMPVESARLAYAPFKNVPAGHVYVVFRLRSGEEVAVSPEADVQEGEQFSLVRGMKKTYRLRYFIRPAKDMAQRLHADGREVREYPLNLSSEQVSQLYKRMSTRSIFLESTFRWYNTLFNSCVTSITNHLNDVCTGRTLSKLSLVLLPQRFSKSVAP